MKTLLFLGSICFCMTSTFGQADRARLSDLQWFAGCWQIDQPERKRLVSEQWMSPVGNAMMGMSRTVRDGKMTGYEFLRIVDDGMAINYISKPAENDGPSHRSLLRG